MKEINLTVLDVLKRMKIRFTEKDLEELLQEEKILQFDAFSEQDAETITEMILRESGMPVTVLVTSVPEGKEICLVQDGDKRHLKYARWKTKTVMIGGHSSLAVTAMAALGEIKEDVFVRQELCMPCGGGFPILVRGEMKAVIAVSGLHRGEDHSVIVRVLQKVLNRQTEYHGVRI